MELKTLRIGLVICACLLIVSNLFVIDYIDSTGVKNMGPYLGILGNLCVIGAAIIRKKVRQIS